MRMRKKPNLVPRMERCARFLIQMPEEQHGRWRELKPDAELRDSGWFQAAIKKMENFHFSTPHVQNLFQEQDARYRWVVSLSSQVQLTRGGVTETGVLLVDMSFSGIEQICRDVQLSNGCLLYTSDAADD